MKLLSEALKANPHFRPGWKTDSLDVPLKNPKFGTILHAAVCDEEGKPLYDQPLWLEGVGAICVDVDAEGRIGLVRHRRPALEWLPDDAGDRPLSSLERGLSLELPRGFPNPDESPGEAAAREAGEETGYAVTRTEFLGYNNTNTTFFPGHNAVFLVELDRSQRYLEGGDPTESIDDVEFHELDAVLTMVDGGEITCGMTKSALLSYIAWRMRASRSG